MSRLLKLLFNSKETNHLIRLDDDQRYSIFSSWKNSIPIPPAIQSVVHGEANVWIDRENDLIYFCLNDTCIQFRISEIKEINTYEGGPDPDRGDRYTSLDLYVTTLNEKSIPIFNASINFDYKLEEIKIKIGIR